MTAAHRPPTAVPGSGPMQEPGLLDLHVSVVSYRTPELLRVCLEALESERSTLRLRVTVTDNASGDDSPALVRDRFPWVSLIRNERNVGFGRAHNQALHDSPARHLLILNSDARVMPGALRTLVEHLDAHPDIGVVGPRLRYPDGTVQPSRRRFPTLATLFLESTQLQRFWPRSPAVRRFYLEDAPENAVQDVDWLVGACLAVRTSAVAQVGLFDERFFLYSEELDWCRRLRAAGWRVVYVPTAEVVHVEGGTSRADPLARDLAFQESKILYAEKWHGPRAARLLRLYLLLEYIARGIEESVKLGLGSRPVERRARLRIIGGYLRHTLLG